MCKYRELLIKYMSHVVDCESTSYVRSINSEWGQVKFMEHEIKQLEEIAEVVEEIKLWNNP